MARSTVAASQKKRTLRFIHSIGHELKQPLSLIKAYTYYLSKYLPPGNDQAHQYPDKINRQVDLLTTMLNDIVETSRLSTLEMKLSKQKIELGKFIQNQIADLKSAYPNRSIQLETNHSPTCILGDRMRLRQAIMNLLVNAINYSEESEPIFVTIKPNTKTILLSITDRGIGIPPSQIKHIFEPYYRTTGSKKRGVKGLGLGLAIVKEILRLHHAKISVQSKVNKGSTFTIHFPKNLN